MTELEKRKIRKQDRFQGIEPFKRRIRVESPTPELMQEGESVTGSRLTAEWLKIKSATGSGTEPSIRLTAHLRNLLSAKHTVTMAGRTQAMHIAIRLAAEQQYGRKTPADMTRLLAGCHVFCPDFTSIETVLPILYEGGEPVFIDALEENWCTDPEALEIAFEKYPDVRIVITSGVYGFAGSIKEIRNICREHNAILIEDATESLCAHKGVGDYIVAGLTAGWNMGGGAVLLTDNDEAAGRAKRMISTSQESSLERVSATILPTGGNPPWRQQETIGYAYQMPEIIAALTEASLAHIRGYLTRKKEIYTGYLQAFDPGLITMNEPVVGETANYSTSAILLESAIPFKEIRTQREYTYRSIHGTASPMEIVEALDAFGAEAFPVYKPMHMQPLFLGCDQISLDGSILEYADKDGDREELFPRHNASKYLFEHGVCLPGSVDMTTEEQDRIIQIVRACFNGADMKAVKRA